MGSKTKKIHHDGHVFYRIAKNGTVLYCLHNRAKFEERTITLELHANGQIQFIELDSEEIKSLLSDVIHIQQGEFGVYTDFETAVKTRIFDPQWQSDADTTMFFRYDPHALLLPPNDDRIDDYLLDIAYQKYLHNLNNLRFVVEKNPIFLQYIRTLYNFEQQVYRGKPMPINVFSNSEKTTGSELLRDRVLRISCVAFCQGVYRDPSWRLTFEISKFWAYGKHNLLSNDYNPHRSAQLWIDLTNADMILLMNKCCSAIGLEQQL